MRRVPELDEREVHRVAGEGPADLARADARVLHRAGELAPVHLVGPADAGTRGRRRVLDVPRAVRVEEGVTDDSFTSIVCEGVEALEGREAVVGYQTANMAAMDDKDATNPFMPKFPKRNNNKGTAPEPKK